tara:strand:+ start:296 stop:424 length:129 start_codon:yes stop_codon:yes gene_type:complete
VELERGFLPVKKLAYKKIIIACEMIGCEVFRLYPAYAVKDNL